MHTHTERNTGAHSIDNDLPRLMLREQARHFFLLRLVDLPDRDVLLPDDFFPRDVLPVDFDLEVLLPERPVFRPELRDVRFPDDPLFFPLPFPLPLPFFLPFFTLPLSSYIVRQSPVLAA